jgi:maltose O-acetyltransferase
MNSRLELKAASFGLLGGMLAISIWRYYDTHLRWRIVAWRRRKRRYMDEGLLLLSELSKMTSGADYISSDEGLKAMLQAAHAMCEEFNSRNRSVKQRQQILSRLLGSCGPPKQSPCIEPPFFCDYGFNIFVGAHFYANFGCVFLDCAEIRIGNHCFLGPGVKLYTAAHPIDAVKRRRVEFAQPIEIGDDVWIGGDAIICPGVKIGSRVVVAAGAVVTKDVPDDVLVTGVPAAVKRHLTS